MKRMHLMLLGLSLVAVLALAACTGVRSDFPGWKIHPLQVSSETGSNDSDMPTIYSDYGDNVIVAWSSDSTEIPYGSDTEIYWRRLNSSGVPQTSPIRLTNNSFGDYYPSVGMSDGITYLVWMGDEITSSNIYWAAVDQSGNFVAGPQIISDLTYNDYDPHLIQCGDYSHVYWSGDSAANDFEIYYAKIRYNGIVDIPYKSVTNMADPEHSPHGEVDQACTRLFIAFEYDFDLTNSDVVLVGVNTEDGSKAFGPVNLSISPDEDSDIDIAVTSAPLMNTLVSVVWSREDGMGGEINYASRHSDGSPCTLVAPLTDDSQFDARPTVENIDGSGNKFALVSWERVEPGTGTDRDIYASLFNDDCSPAPGSPVQISDSAFSANAEDAYPQVLLRPGPEGVPISNVVWRTLNDGMIWARFGSIAGPIGASEIISDESSAGDPSGAERPAPVVVLGPQVYVTWVGNNLGTFETWYQQTVWRSNLPVVIR